MKKALCYILTFMLLVASLVIPSDSFKAYEANISLSVSKSSVKVGDTVTVTVSVPSNVSGPVALYFPTDLMEYGTPSATVNQTGGTVLISIGADGLAKSNKVTVTFKAKASGTATFSVAQAGDVYDDEYQEVSLKKASASVTVANESAEPQKSADNSLSSIKLSNGTLSPSFKYNVTRYTATVGYNVNSITVSAKTSNSKATIKSITGNGTVALSVGENTIQIVVEAENGTTATYTIVVTRKEQSTTEPTETETETETESETETETEDTSALDEVLVWDSKEYDLPDNFSTEMMPEGFAQNVIKINDVDVPCYQFNKGKLTVLCLENENGGNELFIYDEARKSIYPFVKIQSEKSYVMVLLPDDANAPAGAQACTLAIEGKGVVYAYQFVETTEDTTGSAQTSWLDIFGAEDYYAAEVVQSDFYLLYCMNSAGEFGWYVYDSVEGTVQRYLANDASNSLPVGGTTDLQMQNTALATELANAKTLLMILMVVVAALAVLLVVVFILLLKKRSDEGYEYIEDADEVDEEELTEKELNRLGYEYSNEEKKIPEKEDKISEKIEEDDEIEIEFYEMAEEVSKIIAEKEAPVQTPKKTVVIEDDGDDDGIEFIEL